MRPSGKDPPAVRVELGQRLRKVGTGKALVVNQAQGGVEKPRVSQRAVCSQHLGCKIRRFDAMSHDERAILRWLVSRRPGRRALALAWATADHQYRQ